MRKHHKLFVKQMKFVTELDKSDTMTLEELRAFICVLITSGGRDVFVDAMNRFGRVNGQGAENVANFLLETAAKLAEGGYPRLQRLVAAAAYGEKR